MTDDPYESDLRRLLIAIVVTAFVGIVVGRMSVSAATKAVQSFSRSLDTALARSAFGPALAVGLAALGAMLTAIIPVAVLFSILTRRERENEEREKDGKQERSAEGD